MTLGRYVERVRLVAARRHMEDTAAGSMQVVIALFDRFTALDAVGPHQVLHHRPDTEVIFAAERARGSPAARPPGGVQ